MFLRCSAELYMIVFLELSEKGMAGGISFFVYKGYQGLSQCLAVLRHMIQAGGNMIFLEAIVMKLLNQGTYEEKNITVTVERVFTGEKTAKELVLEMLKKRRESGELPK